jgi:hypothetical protein
MKSVKAESIRLGALTVKQLQDEHLRLTGEPLRSNNRGFLTKRILWQLQARAEGGLSERCRARAAELARDSDLRMRPPPEIHAVVHDAPASPPRPTASPTGSVISKVYRGRRLEVRVLERGFEFEGAEYRSLSAIAQKVTGTKWNGRLFFGLMGGNA